VAENDHPPLTWHIALTTLYALTCNTVIKGKNKGLQRRARSTMFVIFPQLCHTTKTAKRWYYSAIHQYIVRMSM